MSDSGFSSISLPGKAAAQKSLGRGGQLIQIISTPKQLSNVAKTLRLAGEITHLGRGGVIRVNTPKGEIEAQVKNPKQLQTGQKLELEIPPGRPPRQATLRSPVNQANNTPTPQQQNISGPGTQPAQTNITAPRDNYVRPQTNFLKPEISGPATPSANNTTSSGNTNLTRTQPVPTQVQQNISQDALNRVANIQSQARPVTAETVIRLLAVPPAQAQIIATETVQNLNVQPAALARVPFTANLIAQNATDQLARTALQISAPQPQTTTPGQTQPNIIQSLVQPAQNTQNLPQPVLTNNFFNAQPTSTTPLLLTPVSPTPGQPVVQVISPQISAAPQVLPQSLVLPPAFVHNVIDTPATSQTVQSQTVTAQATLPQTSFSATLTPVTVDPTSPATAITSQIQRVDIQVVSIKPAEIQLTSPTITASQQPVQVSPQTTQIIPAATSFTPPLTGFNTATTITAQVTGFTPQGLPLVTVQWPGRSMPQSFIMQHNSNNLQLGTQLQITPKAPVLAPIVRQANPLLMGFQWPALDDLYNSLLQISPQAASSLTRTLPNPASPAQIAPAAMMFVAAVRSGDIASWLGDRKMDLIQRAGKESILRSLTQDSTQTTRTAEPASGGDWRAVPLPMFWEGEIQKVTLYMRREQEQQKQDNEEGGQTRFVFDLTLSRMGDVQLDGLLRDKRLDLVVRTQNAFSAPMQQTMRQAYTQALGSTDLSGELNFQGSMDNWVHVLEKEEQLGVHV
jgi:hypothetical protein